MALDLAGLTFATELEIALLANLLGCLARGLEPFAGVELLGVLMARRISVSMLILRTPNLIACWISSTGTP